MSETTQSAEEIRDVVREKYAAAARSVIELQPASCCGPVNASAASCCGPTSDASVSSCCAGDATAAWGSTNYELVDTEHLPDAAVLASLGCGNPTALAKLEPGQTVLDLGSGGGIDVLLSARRVGATGFVYGLDMTDEMLALAERNREAAGAENVRFLKGQIEAIPLPDATVDVIISNCVINLSADKPAVFREAYRVLKPGGLFAVSDVVVQGELPEAIRRNMLAWAGCVAGALEEGEYLAGLRAAGFEDAAIEVTREYSAEEALGHDTDIDTGAGRIVSGFVRARKPGGV